MKKIVFFLFWCGLLLLRTNSESNKDKDKHNDKDEDEDLKIDVSHYPPEAFKPPKGGLRANAKGNADERGEGDDIRFQSDLNLGLINTTYHWKNNIVYYNIQRSCGSEAVNEINAAIEVFHTKTCVKFVKRKNERDFVSITCNQLGCYSSVGRTTGKQILNLEYPGCIYKGIIQHELMHALGFQHEQNREDRETYVTIMFGNIDPNFVSNFYMVKPGTFTVCNISYDYGSIMHYSAKAFSVNGLDTIVPVTPGIPFGQREAMSDDDIKKIHCLYPCK